MDVIKHDIETILIGCGLPWTDTASEEVARYVRESKQRLCYDIMRDIAALLPGINQRIEEKASGRDMVAELLGDVLNIVRKYEEGNKDVVESEEWYECIDCV